MNNHLLAFLGGHVLHLLVFRRGEWDSATNDIIACGALLNLVITAALHTGGGSWGSSLWAAAALEGAGVAGVFASMLAYRVFFHALGRFPGPWAARVSSWHIAYISRRFRLYEELRRLHERYGDIVRIGPSTLSVRKPQAVQAVHGPKSKCLKGPWYEQARPLTSLHTNRDMQAYAQQRKSWEHGLNSAALRDYTPIVVKTTDNLLDKIAASRGEAFDATKWFSFFSSEIMGWMAFDKSFEGFSSGKPSYCTDLIAKSLEAIGVLAHVPWFFVLIKRLPVTGNTFRVFRKWLREQLTAQIEKPPGTSRSLFAAIVKDYPPPQELTPEQRLWLEGDMFLILVAGSDTVAMTLKALFYELSVNQDVQMALRREIDAHFADHGDEGSDVAALAKLEHLQACINETLRLWPPVMSGVQRVTPPEGLQVGDAHIPGDTIVQVPAYLVHRNEEAFPRPNGFIPGRWTTKPELIVDRSAYFPFATGRHSCPGKQLALVELRHAVVEILRRYTVELAPGFTSEDFESGLRDHFTLEAARLDLAFKAR